MLHSSQRWKQIEALFHETAALPEGSRAGFLARRCQDDVALRTEVESLLESEGTSLDFIEQPLISAAHDFTTRSRANRISPGEVIGHYEIVSFIGQGGMGQVYLARDILLGRKVAFKILTSALANNERGLSRFEKEARAASALNHPNILVIYEFGQVDGLYFIASEFVDGPTLTQMLEGGGLSFQSAIDIAIQIAKALEASHAGGIVHRDIKPENVIVRGDRLVKVLDFGIAKLVESNSLESSDRGALARSISLSQAGLVIGSARYMSPEQARGVDVDPRTDIFSLGAVLYEMIAGRPAFEGETISDIIAEILKGVPQRLDEIHPQTPSAIQAIVSKAMCKDREARYQTVKELLADLQQAPGTIPPEARAAVRGNAHKWAAPSKRVTRLAVAAAFTALATIGFFLAGIRYRNSDLPGKQMRPHTLAILPFRNLRQDPSLDYLGFSLSDAVITKLGSVGALTVRPSSSIDRYRNQSIDPQRVAHELNVDTVLTGGFLKDGDDLRITAQLIDIKADKILWRDSMDVTFDKLLTVQDLVSQEIVKGLELNLTPAETQTLHPEKPVDGQAYEDYLRGIDLYSINDFSTAIKMLERSTSLDPNYALAWAHLGKAYTTSATLQLGGREQFDKAEAAYVKAIALDPELPEPRIFMANMLTDTGRVEEAVPLLRTALQTSPR